MIYVAIAIVCNIWMGETFAVKAYQSIGFCKAFATG